MYQTKTSDFNPTMAASQTFETILNTIKSSNLNFQLMLSPFSATISLKKSLVKDKSGHLLSPPRPDSILLEQVKLENESLSKKVKDLERSNQTLKLNVEDSVIDCENAYETIRKLENELKVKQETSDDVKPENSFRELYNKMADESDALSEENKNLRDQNSSLQTQVKNQALQIQDLHLIVENSKSASTRLNREVHENKIKHEKDTKLTIKELKSEIKAWRKDLGEERSEKIKLEKKLETVKKQLEAKATESVLCQTAPNLDIPYKVTTPLPPIFSSQLCHYSRSVFLSNSLPNLNSICWSKPCDDYSEEAEEALAQQYDRQVREFYEDERERVRVVRHAASSGNIGPSLQMNK